MEVRTRQYIQNIVLSLLATLISVLIAEAIIRFAVPQDLVGSWRIATKTGLLVNKSQGRACHQFGERQVCYEFAAPHLRGPIDHANLKVLVLGDSFTFGWLLDSRSNYIAQIQEKINKDFGPKAIGLLNAAAGGWGTADQVAYVAEFGDALDPDMILVFLNTDDIGRAMKSPLWVFDNEQNSLLRVSVPASKLKRIVNSVAGYQWLLEHSHLLQLGRKVALRPRKSPPSDKARDALAVPKSQSSYKSAVNAKVLGKALFALLDSWCKQRGVKLVVTTTGWHSPPYDQPEPTEMFMANSTKFFQELDVPFSDPSKLIWHGNEELRKSLIIPGDGHPNEKGAAVIAENVYPFISEQIGKLCRETGRCGQRSSF